MTGQAFHVNVPHLVVFNQSHEEPESHFFAAVEQEGANDEVHALNVANACVILREGLEDSLQTLLPFAGWLLENLLVREGARDVALDLPFLSHADEVLDAEQVEVALATLLNLKGATAIRQLQPEVCGSARIRFGGRLTRALKAMRAELLGGHRTFKVVARDDGRFEIFAAIQLLNG